MSPTTVARAQRVLTIEDCRAMALENNKQMQVSRVKQSIVENLRKSARTKYLPRVSAIGAYEFTSREISIPDDDPPRRLPCRLGQSIVLRHDRGSGSRLSLDGRSTHVLLPATG